MEFTDTYTVDLVIEGAYEGDQITVDAESHDGAVAAALTEVPDLNDPEAWANWPNHVWLHTAADHGNSVDWTGLMLTQWAAGEDVTLVAK